MRRTWAGLLLLLLLPPVGALAETDDYPADSRIDWLGVDDDFREQARESERPLLYYFHAQWCTWCRRYQDESLEDPEVARRIERDYVPVLINIDRHRDRFSAFDGRGLPYTVVADADDTVLFRFTGHLNPADLRSTLARRAEGEAAPVTPEEAAEADYALDPEAFEAWLEELHDPTAHRFHNAHERGDTGKRPQPLTWRFLLERPAWHDRLEEVLTLMATDLVDPVAGGFYYFTDRDTPYGEAEVETAKVLDVNARLAWTYAAAADALDNPAFAAIADDALAYLNTTLRDPDSGAFFGSQSSDRDYHRLDDAKARAEHGAPPVERVVYTDFNAQAAFAFARIARLQDKPDHAETARAILEHLEAELRDGDGYYHYLEAGDPPEVSGFLPDQAWAAAAWWALARAEGRDGDDLPTPLVRLLAHIEAAYRLDGDDEGETAGYRERRSGRPFVQARSNSLLAWLGTELKAAGVSAAQLDGVDPEALRRHALAGTHWRRGADPDELALAFLALRAGEQP